MQPCHRHLRTDFLSAILSGFPVNGDSNRFAVDGKRLYKCIAPARQSQLVFFCHFKIHVRARWAEEPANFLAAPALALTPDFFSKRLQLRLLFFFSNGSGSKETKTPGSVRLFILSLEIIHVLI